MMKCRLGQAALALPECSLARQEPLAEHLRQLPSERVLHQMLVLGTQGFLDRVWMVQHVDELAREPKSDDVAVLA